MPWNRRGGLSVARPTPIGCLACTATAQMRCDRPVLLARRSRTPHALHLPFDGPTHHERLDRRCKCSKTWRTGL